MTPLLTTLTLFAADGILKNGKSPRYHELSFASLYPPLHTDTQ